MTTDATAPFSGTLGAVRGTAVPSPADAVIGSVLDGRYRIVEVVGQGGMATVYRAHDELLGRDVAVKLFPAGADPGAAERQQAEIRVLAKLSHPGLVTLHDAGSAFAGGPLPQTFLVMELVAGPTLADLLALGALPPRHAARLGHRLAEALAVVHGAGVVHRDIKPANILLAEHERSEDTADLLTTGPLVKLADFGIARYAQDARLTATGTTLGTAMYLSPEQAAGAAVGPPTDVYALGLVLLESMTGVRPFSGTIVETISARLSSDPLVPAGLPAAWRSVLLAMTRRDVDERISAADAATALSALVDALHGEPATASQDAPDAEPAVGRPVEPPELPASPGAEAPGAPGGEAQGASGGEAQGASGAEPPEPTRVLDVERPSVSAAPAVAAGRRRRAVLAGAAAGVALLGGAVFLTLPDGSPATGDPGAGRELPSVEGPLGAAIEDLARSVAP